MKKIILSLFLGMSVLTSYGQFSKDIVNNPTFLDIKLNVNRQLIKTKLISLGFKETSKDIYELGENYMCRLSGGDKTFDVYFTDFFLNSEKIYDDKEAESKYLEFLSAYKELYGKPIKSEITYYDYNIENYLHPKIKEIETIFEINNDHISLRMSLINDVYYTYSSTFFKFKQKQK